MASSAAASVTCAISPRSCSWLIKFDSFITIS
jgi:hypothetical protein